MATEPVNSATFKLYVELTKYKLMQEIILTDNKQRKMALEPNESFIVQAPAGSGKTTLLIQRFLTLLNHANTPEEIIAITFTRKAAFEMRSRIISALEKANLQSEKSSSPHSQNIKKLADLVLQRSQSLKWHLLENPNRLRILTIDALCATLTKHMPILSRCGANLKISDDPTKLYEQTIDEIFLQIDSQASWIKSLKQVLTHLDNRTNLAKKLLINMLAKRDQWLPYILNAHDNIEQLRHILEKGLFAITKDNLERLNLLIPKTLSTEIVDLANFAENILAKHNNQPKSNFNLLLKNNTLDSPPTVIQQKEIWLKLTNLLLTKDNTWRKSITKNIGFPPPSNTKNNIEKKLYSSMKNRMQLLLTQLADNSDLQQALTDLRYTPPLQYDEQQWQMITALLTLLPIAAAQLTLVFRENKQVDFNEIAQAALTSLGTSEAPTDLALILDHKIQHILVDEFQDTSTIQFRLLEQLTAEWLPNDGHSLFLVGDPMQSIYRFRDAEVGLFLRARHEGINQIKLTPLTLAVNFRSEKHLVDWFNHTFTNIFPHTEEISAGAVTYTPSTSIYKQQTKEHIHLHSFVNTNDQTEAEYIAKLIRKLKKEAPAEKIAILVKARTHLNEILPSLRNNNIRYQAVEIDPLNSRSTIQDLLALTKALLHLADRTSWLAILHAPWCGLNLQSLHDIAYEHPNLTIWQCLQTNEICEKLTDEEKLRLNHLKNVLSQSLQTRNRKKLRIWIYETWLALNGPACVTSETDLEDANTYFQLLESLEQGGSITNFSLLEEKILSLFASPDHLADDSLQIMTIHKAKGLEFDQVILPGLHRLPSRQNEQLLLWLERTRTHKDSDLILAPIKYISYTNDKIYDYLAREHKLKNYFEDMRLLYVAVTRTKKHLHLIGNMQKNTDHDDLKRPTTGSFLNLLWPTLKADFYKHAITHHHASSKDQPIEKKETNKIIKVPYIKQIEITKTIGSNNISPTDLLYQNHPQRYIGTLIHRILQQISLDTITAWPLSRLEKATLSWRAALLTLGILPEQLDHALGQINLAITNTLTDKRGQWILDNHQDSKSEFAITTTEKNKPKVLIIDRTFIDKNKNRWIIDYKTTYPLKNNLPTTLSINEYLDSCQQDTKFIENFLQTEKKNIVYN